MGLLDRLPRPRLSAATLPEPVAREARGDRYVEPIGGAGTINYRGLLQSEEYNPDLRWPQSLNVYERMRRSDSTVREALWHVYAEILAADVDVIPPRNPSDDEIEQTELIRSVLFEWMDQSWPELLTQILSYLPVGHSVFEPVFKLVEKELTVERRAGGPDDGPPTAEMDELALSAAAIPADPILEDVPAPAPAMPEAETVPRRQYVALRKLAQRMPRTITEWHVDAAGELTRVVQLVPKTKRDGTQDWEEISIPAERLLVFVNEKEGDDWRGLSILRSAYKAWVLKEMVERIAGIAYERHGAGLPVGYVPEARSNDKELIDELASQLANLRAGEFSYLLLPGPKSTGNMPGYNFEILSPGGTFPDFRDWAEYLRGEIKGAMLVRFSELGHGQAGARATASSQSEVWYAALLAVANHIASQFDVLIRRVIDMNYPDVERYPKLQFSGIRARNLLEFAQATALAANAGLLAADGPTRAWLREEFDAPTEDPDEAMYRQELDQQRFQLEKGSTAEVFSVEEDPAETARPRNSKTNTPD